MKKVVILGGGVAGMSAAHELIERGFQVSVYELKSIPGGKARSVPATTAGPVDPSKQPLPGEHGFRFFPAFYRHVTDTMKRIPYKNNRNGVFDNLVHTTRSAVVCNTIQIQSLTGLPKSIKDLEIMIHAAFSHAPEAMGLTQDDLRFYSEKLWQFVTTCQQRRMQEYEKISWWDYIGANRRSQEYQKYLAGISRVLVAAKPNAANAKVHGDILVQIMMGMSEINDNCDRVLNGPTNDVWINPWLTYLHSRGVEYHYNAETMAINCVDGRIVSATINQEGQTFEAQGDYYIAALPVEVMARLLNSNPALVQADPNLKGIQQIGQDVDWMNGMQFYLKDDETIVNGHMMYLDSPWALTSISQHQFWQSVDLSTYGDGSVRGIISVDISDWHTPGVVTHKTAKLCDRDEIKQEVWEQIKQTIQNVPDDQKDDLLHSWFLDPDIIETTLPSTDTSKYTNKEPLYIAKLNTWRLRPEATTAIPNLFLASDYVRTNTQLATMEAANEAARRAVNAIIVASGYRVPQCKIWKLREPLIFLPWKWYDTYRYMRGKPWVPQIPMILRVLFNLMLYITSLRRPHSGHHQPAPQIAQVPIETNP